MTTWARKNYEVPDARLVQAEREIYRQYGDMVSIDAKAKSLIKFGKSSLLTAGDFATVWTRGNDEVYVDTNSIDTVSSSVATDVEELYLECHTISGTNSDEKFDFLTQVVAVNGQNKVLLPIPVARVSTIYNNNGKLFGGEINVYEDTPIVAGVPTDLTKVHAHIEEGFQQSFKAATTFSDEDYYIMTGAFGAVSLKATAVVDFYLEIRPPGSIFRQIAATSANSSGGAWSLDFDPTIIIPKNSDIRVRVESDSNNAVAFANFKGYIAKVVT